MTERVLTLPTIEDVASAAGVSTATVSRVLNRPEAVREALRRQVQAAIARLGYVPHAGARSLMLRRSGTVGAIFPTVDNAIFAKAIDALQRRLDERGAQLLLSTTGYDADAELRHAHDLLRCGADALVLCGTAQRPELLDLLRRRAVPSVHVMSWPAPAGLRAVGFDNARAMRMVVEYLVELGHRRIAMLAGITRDNDRAAARVAGVRAALHAAGLDLPDACLVERRYAVADARDGLRQLLQVARPPTAIICGNDVLAMGALFEARRLGRDVPSQLSLVGFDDLELAEHLEPGLTTVRVPSEAMWREAADVILARLRGEDGPGGPGAAPRGEVQVSLVVRGTTGPAPASGAPGRRPAARR